MLIKKKAEVSNKKNHNPRQSVFYISKNHRTSHTYSRLKVAHKLQTSLHLHDFHDTSIQAMKNLCKRSASADISFLKTIGPIHKIYWNVGYMVYHESTVSRFDILPRKLIIT